MTQETKIINGKYELVYNHPVEWLDEIIDGMEDPRGWKYPMGPSLFSDKSLAEDVYQRLIDICGGAELGKSHGLAMVSTKGYYHYVGA